MIIYQIYSKEIYKLNLLFSLSENKVIENRLNEKKKKFEDWKKSKINILERTFINKTFNNEVKHETDGVYNYYNNIKVTENNEVKHETNGVYICDENESENDGNNYETESENDGNNEDEFVYNDYNNIKVTEFVDIGKEQRLAEIENMVKNVYKLGI